MTKLCVVIAERDLRRAISAGREALAKGADLVELRADYLPEEQLRDVSLFSRVLGHRSVATLRSKSEGGLCLMESRERLRNLRSFAILGFRFVDVELRSDARFLEELRKVARDSGSEFIVSVHHMKPTPVEEVREELEECCSLGDVGKAAVQVDRVLQAIDLLELAKEFAARERRFVLIGMGREGVMTRLLAEDSNQELCYVSPSQLKVAASGQVDLASMRRFSGRSKFIAALIGHPITHSISPAIHNAAFESLSLPGIYVALDVGKDELKRIVEDGEERRLRGLNVTVPYKVECVPLLDYVDPAAEDVGAVNTVLFEQGKTKGFNTDVYGFERMLRNNRINVRGKRALVLGAGGAARAVVSVLLSQEAEVCLANRSASRADDLAQDFDDKPEVLELEELVDSPPFSLLINSTPVGTKGFPEFPDIPLKLLRKDIVVIDLVYNPLRTALLKEAEERGAKVVNGLDMLVHQAAKSFEIWTRKEAPLDVMKEAALGALR